MVETRIDEFQCDNGHSGDRGNFGVGLPIGPEAGAGQDGLTGHQEVALAFVDVTGGDRGVALLGHPLRVGHRLTFALGMFEAGDDRGVVHDQPAVGCVDHVRQAGDGLDHVDGVAEFAIGVAQGLPLCDREVDVDLRTDVHPGIDRVLDGEERRTGHGVSAEASAAGCRATRGDIGRNCHGEIVLRRSNAINRCSLRFLVIYIA